MIALLTRICITLTILGAILLGAAPAAAHLMPNSVIYLDFADDHVTAELLVPINELRFGSGLAIRSDPAGFAADKPVIARYLIDHFAARGADGKAWRVRLTDLRPIEDPYQADLQARIELLPPAGASPRKFDLTYDGVIDRVANHFVLVFARSDFRGGTLSGGDPAMIGGLQAEVKTVHVDRGTGGAWRGFAAAIGLGMHHIAEGHDHLLFLIALILPAPLIARGRRWGDYGGARHTARRLVAVVSAFTVGHSLTLIGGAVFGWNLPSRPVEIGIALSILVSAIHAWRPIFAGREALIAGGFGLVHGLAFATVIGHFVADPWQKAQSILGFNLGIELVQLAVVAGVLPALLMLARMPVYARLRTAGAILAGVAAIGWIVERVTDRPNPIAGGIDLALGYAPWAVALLTILAAWLRYGAPRLRTAGSGSAIPPGRTATADPPHG